MEEPPGGHNAGRRASDNPGLEGRHVALGVEDAQASEYVRGGGWTLVSEKDGSRAGVSAHRGVLHKDEHVDEDAVLAAVEHEFGFTRDDVHAVYRQGRLSPSQGELRAQIDARLLALSRAGTNLMLLGRLLGFAPHSDRQHKFIRNALERARAAELANPKEARDVV